MKDISEMTKREICKCLPPIARYCGYRDIAIHHIDYDIEDHVVYSENLHSDNASYHRSKIHYGDDDSYFMAGKQKILLSECVKCDSMWGLKK